MLEKKQQNVFRNCVAFSVILRKKIEQIYLPIFAVRCNWPSASAL